MSTDLISKRKQGGFGWADTIFRFQADNPTYAKVMIGRVLKKLNLEKENYKIYSSESGFVLIKGNDIILQIT